MPEQGGNDLSGVTDSSSGAAGDAPAHAEEQIKVEKKITEKNAGMSVWFPEKEKLTRCLLTEMGGVGALALYWWRFFINTSNTRDSFKCHLTRFVDDFHMVLYAPLLGVLWKTLK